MNPFDETNPFSVPTSNLSLQDKFNASKVGVVANTVAGLVDPTNYLKVGRDILQGIARSAGSAGLTFGKALGGADAINPTEIKSPFFKGLYKTFFGSEPIKPVEDRIAEAEIAIKNSPFAQKTGLDKMALPIAFGGVIGSEALDLTPFGGLEKNAVRQLVKETSAEVIAKTLKSMNITEEIATKFAPYLASAKTEGEVVDILNNLKGTLGVKLKSESLNSIMNVEDLSKSLDNSLQKNRTGVREKSLDYFRNNPEEITKQPIKIRQVEGKTVLEDGRHRLEVARELGIKNLNVEDVTNLYKPIQTTNTDKQLLEQEISRLTTPEVTPSAVSKSPELTQPVESEASTLIKSAQELFDKAPKAVESGGKPLPSIIKDMPTPVNKKVNVLDYFRTPEKVLNKIGLGEESKLLRKQYEGYLKELPENIDIITKWSKEVPLESNARIFKYLDGQEIDLNAKELKVANEIKDYLKNWADRLGLPEDKRVANYITHLFDQQLLAKEFDEDLAKIIAEKIPGSVYDPFLQKRLGALGYKEDTWAALDAYTKRATRKVYLDPALEKIADKAASFEESQWNYVKRFIDRVNMRPTEIDNLIDNTIKSSPIGYKFGQRPLTVLSRKARQWVYRGTLGLNIGSALRNLTQGVNTYAELGEKFTATGYLNLLKNGTKELKDVGILADDFIQDRSLSAVKTTMQKLDKGLFVFFEIAEKINRGSAYYGAKAKALSEGKTLEQAIEYGKEIVRKTQFSFGKIDTPVALQSDLAKTIVQLQSFTLKQVEFLGGKVAKKEFAGLARYIAGSLAMVYTVGQLFGMKLSDIIPSFRFGTTPTLTLPKDALTDVITGKDKYGNPLTTKKVTSQLIRDTTPYIPAGVQLKKTIQGAKAGGGAQKLLFGKYAGSTTSKKTSTTNNPFNQ